MDTNEIKFIIAGAYPFNKLSEKDIAVFINLCQIKEFKNNEIIYKEGDLPDYFYMVLGGRVVASVTQNGKEQEIELLKRGTPFGIISLFNEEPHSVTARSIEVSTIMRIDKAKFLEFLAGHPQVSFEFSRILSSRVRARFKPKSIFQSKKIAVLGLPYSGKTTYILSLGVNIKKNINKKVICVEISSRDDFQLVSGSKDNKVLNLTDFREESVAGYIIEENVDCLMVKAGSETNLDELLNWLSENYHFVLIEMPHLFLERHYFDFVSKVDYVHILSRCRKDDLAASGLIAEGLKNKNISLRERIKIVVTEFGEKEDIDFAEKIKLLNHSIYVSLPSLSDEDYFKAVRRVSREISEIILGLALGSGGAFGFSHIGVFKVLEDNNIDIDVICGTSMGAVFATMRALGMSSKDMAKVARDIGKKINLVSLYGFTFPSKGIIRAKALEGILKTVFGNKTFYDLKYPLKIVSFDFLNRHEKIFESGLIYKAVAASCAMPGIFEPIKVGDDFLLDGGIISPLPAKTLYRCGTNRIIGVDTSPSLEETRKIYKKKSRPHIFDFIFGSIETMQKEFVEQSIKVCDVTIKPNLDGLEWLEFTRVDEFVKRGEEAALAKLPDIKKLAVTR